MAKNLDPQLKKVIKEFINYCPSCGDYKVLDNRTRLNEKLQRPQKIKPILIIRRWSANVIQFECSYCDLRFSVYWKRIIMLLRNDGYSEVNLNKLKTYLSNVQRLEANDKKVKKELKEKS